MPLNVVQTGSTGAAVSLSSAIMLGVSVQDWALVIGLIAGVLSIALTSTRLYAVHQARRGDTK